MSIYMFNNGVMKNRKWKSMNIFSISFCLSLYYKAFLDDERGSTKKKKNYNWILLFSLECQETFIS